MEMGGSFSFGMSKLSGRTTLLTIALALWSRINCEKKVPSQVKNGSTVTDSCPNGTRVLHNNQG